MTALELCALVPIHCDKYGQPHFISMDEIPEPWKSQFRQALRGSACPKIMGFVECAFAVDWFDWVNGMWRDQNVKPIGFDET